MNRSTTIAALLSLALLSVGAGCLSVRSGQADDDMVRVTARIDRYDEDAKFFYTPDQVCPSMDVTIESPQDYTGATMTIGLVSLSADEGAIYKKLPSFVGKRVIFRLTVKDLRKREGVWINPGNLQLQGG